MTQREFGFWEAKVTDPNVIWLVEMLAERRAWMTAKQVSECSLGRVDDRQVRALAEAAAPELISGQRGYKHVRHASPEEVHRFVCWMESQARKMFGRAESVRRRAHQLFG